MSLSHRSGILEDVTPTDASPTPWRALRTHLGRVAGAASSPLVPADFLDLFAPLPLATSIEYPLAQTLAGLTAGTVASSRAVRLRRTPPERGHLPPGSR